MILGVGSGLNKITRIGRYPGKIVPYQRLSAENGEI